MMIPIPVFWTKYTSTMQGRVLKFVPCENCSTEYVYVLERESTGTGTSMYMLNEDGAATHAQSAAADTLKCFLENDFDPIPCPACGHYQRFMFPKLLETKGMSGVFIRLVIIMIGCVAALGVLKYGVAYLQHPSEAAFMQMLTPCSVLLLSCLLGFGLSFLHKRAIRRFDPNLSDQQTRIALGRSRAVTRAEFEKGK